MSPSNTVTGWPDDAWTIVPSSQSPKIARTPADLSASDGSASTRLALKMCGRCVSVKPWSSPGLVRSLTLSPPTPFSPPVSVTLPVVRDSV